MAVGYSLLFKKRFDSLDTCRKIFLENGVNGFTGGFNKNYFTINLTESCGLSFNMTQVSDYVELSLGKYEYETKWVIELDKDCYNKAINKMLLVISSLVANLDIDFVLLLNGELVILQLKNSVLYLNRVNDFWDLNDSSIFNNTIDEVYPIL